MYEWWRLVVRGVPFVLAGLSIVGTLAFSVAINTPTRPSERVSVDVPARLAAVTAGRDSRQAPLRAQLAACVPGDVAGQAASVLVVGLSGVTDASQPLVAGLRAVGVGGVVLNDTNLRDQVQARALVAGLRARLGAGLLVVLDEEGGRVTSLARLGATGPSARRLGRRPGADIEAAGARLGALASRLGFDLILAPVADLDAGPARGVIGDRSFGGDPVEAGQAARRFAAAVRGQGVGSTAKHFPGHSGGQDSHLGPARSDISRAELLDSAVAAFRPLLADRVEAVMVGHVTYDVLGPLPASLNPAAFRLLRDEGFTGPAMTDSLGMGAIQQGWGFDRAAVAAVGAGADILLANQAHAARPMRDALVAAVGTGSLPAARLREAAIRAATLRPGCEDAASVLLGSAGRGIAGRPDRHVGAARTAVRGGGAAQ